jgi:hypothetical protein
MRENTPQVNGGRNMGARCWLVTHLVASAAGLALPSTTMAANYRFVKIADSAQFSRLGERVSINNHGTVAFNASPSVGVQGVFTGAGGPIATIIERSDSTARLVDPRSAIAAQSLRLCGPAVALILKS